MSRILVVDDIYESRRLLADVVMALGVEPVEAASGPEALARAVDSRPDLIVLDVSMPGMSGFEVVERLKQDPETAAIPVLMLTALADVEHRVMGLKLGADDYLTKPYNPRELMARISARLRQKEVADDLREQRQMIRATFERYVAPAVVEQLLADPSQVVLGGRLQEITVMFADLEGYTGLSEQTPPEALLAVLNAYHTMLVGVVRAKGGTVDKFMGDGMIAFYNTPLLQPDHPLRAVQTALAIRDGLSAFHAGFEPEFRLGVNFGIHTGMAVVGNVGAPDMMNFTAVGDTVNIAARLQDESSGGQILISTATFERLEGQIPTRPSGLRQVKGRVNGIMTYEVLG
ncbi:MAG: adenylate/guanylate cyclase domain-containing protein [Anaerolineae bacterium]